MTQPLTGIGSRRTPGIPIELTYAPYEGLPLDTVYVLIIGRAASGGGAETEDTIVTLTEFIDPDGAQAEAETAWGTGAEIANMVYDFVTTISGGAFFPRILMGGIPYAADIATVDLTNILAAAVGIPTDYIIVPVPWEDDTNMDLVKTHVVAKSAASKTDDQMFGTIAIAASFEETPATAYAANDYDTRFFTLAWLRDSDASPPAARTEGRVAAQYGALVAANPIPFNPINKKALLVDPPVDEADWIDQGFNGTAESALTAGLTPLSSDRQGNVRVIRSVVSATTQDEAGGSAIQTYFDVQDIQVLFFYRRALWTRFQQSDFVNVKASSQKAFEVRSAALQMAALFEQQGMFQKVRELAPFFQIERNASDRTRFDIKMPVNVVPGLHAIAGNIEAGTRFDVLTI